MFDLRRGAEADFGTTLYPDFDAALKVISNR
jgi:hypothetical protein